MVRFSNKSIGVLGGSFDPAHKGHIKIKKISIEKIKLKKILWVVTEQNPFKRKPFYSLSQRIEKAKKLIKKDKRIQIIHLEKSISSTRSIDTIRYLINKKPQKTFILLLDLII